MKRLAAALMFFTRLPLWKLVKVPSECFSRVVELWPVVGWITGGLAALVLWGAALVMPVPVAVLLALAARTLLTGALHEDGLADFFDGFGGGTSRERILAIMKDSHIGTFGVIGLVLWYLLTASLWMSLPLPIICFVVLAADPWSKFCAAQLINFLPYARPVEQAKNGTVYQRFGFGSWLVAFVAGIVPAVWLELRLWIAYAAPVVVVALLIAVMKRKIGGYTGDCCGATFLLCELSFYLSAVVIWNL